jgi:hypothetical protein
MINDNFTEFVDQDRSVDRLRVLEQAVQRCGLVSAEEPRQHGDRYEFAHVSFTGCTAAGASCERACTCPPTRWAPAHRRTIVLVSIKRDQHNMI